MGKNATPRPQVGEPNQYDQTRNLTLTIEDRTAGYEIVICPTCEAGRRGRLAHCGLCGGAGRIKALDPERNFDQDRPQGRGGRPKGSKDSRPRKTGKGAS